MTKFVTVKYDCRHRWRSRKRPAERSSRFTNSKELFAAFSIDFGRRQYFLCSIFPFLSGPASSGFEHLNFVLGLVQDLAPRRASDRSVFLVKVEENIKILC